MMLKQIFGNQFLLSLNLFIRLLRVIQLLEGSVAVLFYIADLMSTHFTLFTYNAHHRLDLYLAR